MNRTGNNREDGGIKNPFRPSSLFKPLNKKGFSEFLHLKIIHDKIKIHGIVIDEANIMSLEELIAKQEALALAEEQEEELKQHKAPKNPKAGTGRGNSIAIKVVKATDAEGKRLEVITADAVDNYQWLTPKQKKARRKYDRRKEQKQIEALSNEVEDF